MNLGRAVNKFSTVHVDGWDGTGWVKNVAAGALEVYSRFITERTFGAVKRIYLCHEPIPDVYTVLRMVDGRRYLLSFLNPDIIGDTVYGYVYLLQMVTHDAAIAGQQITASASGVGGIQVEVLSDPIPCYLERFSGTTSTEADDLVYSRTRILLPRGTTVKDSDEVKVDQTYYSIKEIDEELDLVRLYTVRG